MSAVLRLRDGLVSLDGVSNTLALQLQLPGMGSTTGRPTFIHIHTDACDSHSRYDVICMCHESHSSRNWVWHKAGLHCFCGLTD